MEYSSDQSFSEYKHGPRSQVTVAAPPTGKVSFAVSILLSWELGVRLREWEAPLHPSPPLRLLIFSLEPFLKTIISEKFTIWTILIRYILSGKVKT